MNQSQTPILVSVMGPTASGKTDLAEALARELDAQLINADAFQVYRGLDIGTAKPSAPARYKLLDIKDPTENFGVGEFVELASVALAEAFEAKRNAILVGGTGLYIRALTEGYAEMRPPPDPELRRMLMEREASVGLEVLAQQLIQTGPELAARTDLRNPARVRRALERVLDPRPPLKVELPNFRQKKLALNPKVEIINARIDLRIRFMVQNGWVDEVRRLVGEGIPREAPGLRAIGYRGLYDHVRGVSSLEAALQAIGLETRQYAKRQRTWLRSEPNLTELMSGQTTEHALTEAMRYIAL
ncbi:MAG TPA: tRNA (adenosine(37)-N6)-dimethylallyltransferase MiaA [Fimbriimonadaceae bacterium]|nr:tRNA (adenosine(37)-N6)-dimethylallyltransferase MiaA [Fimbriimonadaceae bacterium]